MSLLLRHDASERVLRSVGDPPHGAIGISTDNRGEVELFVTPSERLLQAGGNVHFNTPAERDVVRAGEGMTLLDLDDALAALADLEAGTALYLVALTTIEASLRIYGPEGDLEAIEAVVEFAKRIRDGVQERFK